MNATIPIFRAARRDEAARLCGFMRRLFVASYGHAASPEDVALFLDGVYTPAQQAAELANPDIHTVIVEDGGDDWAGFAQLRFATARPAAGTLANSIELGRIYLAPRCHGRGYGTRLLAHLEALTRARGHDGLWLSAWQQAPQALRFYEREGFVRVGTAIFSVGRHETDDWIVEKRIG